MSSLDRSPAVPLAELDRAVLLDRLGPVDQPPPEIQSWLSRAPVADRLPQLVDLDQESSYALCVEVVRRLFRRTGTPG